MATAATYPPSADIKYWPPPQCPNCKSQAVIKVCGPESKNPGRKYYGCASADFKNNKDSKCNKLFQWADITVGEAKAAKQAYFKEHPKPPNNAPKPAKAPESDASTTSSDSADVMAQLAEIKDTLYRIEHILNGDGASSGPAPMPPNKRPCFGGVVKEE